MLEKVLKIASGGICSLACSCRKIFSPFRRKVWVGRRIFFPGMFYYKSYFDKLIEAPWISKFRPHKMIGKSEVPSKLQIIFLVGWRWVHTFKFIKKERAVSSYLLLLALYLVGWCQCRSCSSLLYIHNIVFGVKYDEMDIIDVFL